MTAIKVDNYAGIKTSREVPMYQALAESLNLPAVATVNDLGVDKAFESGEKFGLNMEKSTVFLVWLWEAVLKPILFKWLKHMLPLQMKV